MKPFPRKLMSVVLALTMLLTVFSVAAFAATRDNVRSYKVYTSQGDSIAAGFSRPDYKKKAGNKYCLGKTRIEGSYPALVADDLKVQKFFPLASPGFRSNELRFLLCNDYDSDYVTRKWVQALSHIEENTYEGLINQRSEYQSAVASSDILTLDIGLNDTWLPVMGAIQEIIYNGNPKDSVIEMAADGAAAVDEGYSLDDLKHDLGIIVNSPRHFNKLIGAAGTILTLSDYLPNYEAIVKRIFELNPNTTVVALSTYNPFRDWPEEWAPKLADAAQKVLYSKMNDQKAQLHEKYGDKFLVADINDVPPLRHDSYAKVSAAGGLANWDPHPTEVGHRYIEEQILKVLPTA